MTHYLLAERWGAQKRSKRAIALEKSRLQHEKPKQTELTLFADLLVPCPRQIVAVTFCHVEVSRSKTKQRGESWRSFASSPRTCWRSERGRLPGRRARWIDGRWGRADSFPESFPRTRSCFFPAKVPLQSRWRGLQRVKGLLLVEHKTYLSHNSARPKIEKKRLIFNRTCQMTLQYYHAFQLKYFVCKSENKPEYMYWIWKNSRLQMILK